jgi:hypothetical protein
MASEPKEIRSHCNGCARETKHIVLASRRVEDGEELEDYGPIEWWDLYELVECRGCENVSMRHTYYFGPTEELTTTTYPPKSLRRRPHWFHQLPKSLLTIMEQTYQALDNDGRALALMGARAAVDMVMTDKVGDAGSFANKLDALEQSGIIGSRNRAVLNAALDAGNAAAHRGYQPSTDDTNAVMDIVENLLQASYHLSSLAGRLKQSTPKRKGRRKRVVRAPSPRTKQPT